MLSEFLRLCVREAATRHVHRDVETKRPADRVRILLGTESACGPLLPSANNDVEQVVPVPGSFPPFISGQREVTR